MVWIIDASFAVHMCIESHTGNAFTLELRSPISRLHKQTSNTTSSTVSEIHGISNATPMMEWTENFTQPQVQDISDGDD